MEFILKRIENNFRGYAGAYLGIDSVKYEKGCLIISRKGDDPFTEIEKSMIGRFLSIYRRDISHYDIRGSKIQVFTKI